MLSGYFQKNIDQIEKYKEEQTIEIDKRAAENITRMQK